MVGPDRTTLRHEDWIYISGPITGADNYMEAFSSAEMELADKGWRVINPAKMGWILPGNAGWIDFMAIDFMLLASCSSIYMLPNWENSKGAKEEIAFARKNGIQIFYQEKAIRQMSGRIVNNGC